MRPQDVAGTMRGKYCILMSRGAESASPTKGGIDHGRERKKNPWKRPSSGSGKRQASHRNKSLKLLASPCGACRRMRREEYPPPFDRAEALAGFYGCSIAAFAQTEGGDET